MTEERERDRGEEQRLEIEGERRGNRNIEDHARRRFESIYEEMTIVRIKHGQVH